MTETSDVLQDVLWVEKYRPTQLADVALDDDNRKVLEAYLTAGEIPHLLFIGPPGTGKTTLSRILYRALDCEHMVLNASSDRGIDVVRGKIAAFVRAMSIKQWNIVFLDEADAMTNDAQTAMRNLIESYSERSRFVLTANHQYKIIGAIQSRCLIINLVTPPLKERYRILAKVLKAEGIKASKEIIFGYAERFPDMRRMLMQTQQVFLAQGILPPARETNVVDGESLYDMLVNKNWLALRRLTATEGFDARIALTDLFWAVPDDSPKVGFLRHTLGHGVHETTHTPDPVILFLGVCAECMEGL